MSGIGAFHPCWREHRRIATPSTKKLIGSNSLCLTTTRSWIKFEQNALCRTAVLARHRNCGPRTDEVYTQRDSAIAASDSEPRRVIRSASRGPTVTRLQRTSQRVRPRRWARANRRRVLRKLDASNRRRPSGIVAEKNGFRGVQGGSYGHRPTTRESGVYHPLGVTGHPNGEVSSCSTRPGQTDVSHEGEAGRNLIGP